MASCQTIWKERVARNLLLYLQMQQYLQELTQCCITQYKTREGLWKAGLENFEYTEHCL